MGKKEGKKNSTPLVEQAQSQADVVDEAPWWEESFRSKPLEMEGFTFRVYMVREDNDRDADLIPMLISAVGSGVRRRFALLEYEEMLKVIPDPKKPVPEVKPKPKAGGKGGKGGKREQPAQPSAGVPPEQGMLAAVGELLRSAGQLDVASTAMVAKHALSLLLKERCAVAGAADLLPIPPSPEPPSSAKAPKKKEAPAKKKKASMKSEKAAAIEEDKAAEKAKLAEKEDREFEAFCDTRPSALRKRGEPQEPSYKDDEPADGPDLYVLLIGFSDPRLPRELAACGVHVEAMVRLGSAQCRLRGLKEDASSAAVADGVAQFWSELSGHLTAGVGRLQDTALAEVTVDRCRVQFAPSAAGAADQVYTAVARELYRYLRLRALFERYTQSVLAVPVPDAPRPKPPPPPPPAEPPADPAAPVEPPPPAEPEPPPLDPCLEEPTEYRRLLAPLPPETVTVPLLVHALVEQVSVWALPAWQRQQQESPSEPPADQPDREASWEELERRVRLEEEFPPRPDRADRGPVLVCEGDAVNAAFSDWADREPVLSAEHVLTQTAELQALQSRPPAPTAALWRHQAARQELQTAEGGPRSEPAAELLLRQLLFESLYAALTPAGCGGGVRPYPHPCLPVQSVVADAQHLVPECGDGRLAEDAAPLDTRDQLLTLPPRFAEFRVSERLDRLTMAQALESARDGRRRLAAYHFHGDDGLYLVYGHPRVRGGSLSDDWERRAHTAVGLRDFVEHVQHWPEVRAWMERQYGQLLKASAARPTPPSRPGSATDSLDTPPAEPPPPGSGVRLPDAVFLVPGSLKHEASMRQKRSEEAPVVEASTQPSTAPSAKPTDKKRKESRRRSDHSPRKVSAGRGRRGEEGGSPSPPPPATISAVQFEIRPQSPDTGVRQRSPSPVPLPKVFAGYSVSLPRLLDVRGGRQRQYFSDGSHVTVRRSQYVHGPAALAVSVRRGETRLTLHPGGERHELVAVLPGGVLLHPQTALREPPAAAPPPPAQDQAPPPPAAEEPPSLPPQMRKSVRHRSPPEKSKKKEPKKEKKAEPKRGSSKKRQASVEVESPLAPAEEPADRPAEGEAERPAGQRVQTLRLSCPSGLVVELHPEPFWPGPEPRLRVVQYYVTADCERRRVRVFLSDGSLLQLRGEDQPEDEVLVLSTDGGLTTCRRSEAGLEPLRSVTGAGRRRCWAADAAPEPRPLLTKMATDPVTRELYLQREDGARAVIRLGGQSVLELPDGTRVTISPPPPVAPPADAEPRPPGCSDYLVTEAGWVGAPTVSWLLGAQVTIDDAASAQRAVMIEHPEYARVEMDQVSGRCRVLLPQGLLLEAGGGGCFSVSQPDGCRLQLDEQLLCFSGPGSSERRPVVHTLRLAAQQTAERGDSAAETDSPGSPNAGECVVDASQPASLCETVESDGAVWRVTPGGCLEPVGTPPEPLPDPLPLQLREQIDHETVMAEPPRLFVLYRYGDGVQLLSASEAEAYLEYVQRTPGALIISDSHQHDAELSVIRAFRPVGSSLTERWHVPYAEATIVPPNLRCRDLQLLCHDAVPPGAGATVWGGGDPVEVSPPPDKAPQEGLLSGLVCTRELLVVPPLPEHRRVDILHAINALRLRWRTESLDSWPLPGVEPPLMHVQHVYEPDRLLSFLSAPPAAASPPAEEVPRHRRQSRASFVKADIRELDKILIYREMLRRRRFPGFFLTSAGREFLSSLRQTPAEERPAPARRRLVEEPLRLRPRPRSGPQPPPVGPDAVWCHPPRLDLGLVRPDRPVCAELQLCSGADTPLEFRVTPPGPPVGVRVWPERGLLPAGGRTPLRVQLTPTAEVRSRSVFCLLEVTLDGGRRRLCVPVVACVAGGGAAQVLTQESCRA